MSAQKDTDFDSILTSLADKVWPDNSQRSSASTLSELIYGRSQSEKHADLAGPVFTAKHICSLRRPRRSQLS